MPQSYSHQKKESIERSSELDLTLSKTLSSSTLKISIFMLIFGFTFSGCYPDRVESIKLMNKGIKEYRSGSSAAAARLLARSAETDRTNHRALFYRGLILNEMGRLEERSDRFEDAIQSLKSSIMIEAGDPEVHYQLGVALSELERDQSAVNAFSDANAIKPHGEAAYRSGLINLKLEKYNKAQENFRAAILAKPDLGLAYTALSQLYRRFKKKSAAVTVLKNAIENDPEEMNHYRDLGEVYAGLKQYSKAIQLFETAIQEHPTNAVLTFLLGSSYFQHGDVQSSEIYIKKYLRMGHTKDEKLMIAKAKRILAKLRKK
jgi:tetratricopeptide (TPR) repeat protein